MAQPATTIRVCQSVMKSMLEEARRHHPLECCGLLAGRQGLITDIYPATNALESPVAFEIPPEELFRFFREMRNRGLEHLGIYHSHPSGDTHPSAQDVERAYYPDVAYFVVVSHREARTACAAFSIRDGQVRKMELEILEAG
ncbi:MAG TPA: M67 family metallopeptidase [Candidatus Acidoferrales bacterium]